MTTKSIGKQLFVWQMLHVAFFFDYVQRMHDAFGYDKHQHDLI